MVRPSGKLIIAGQELATDAPIVNMRESGYDASIQRCLNEQSHCTDGIFPMGNPTDPPHRSVARAVLRSMFTSWPGSAREMPTVGQVKQIVRQVVLHQIGVHRADMAFAIIHDELGLSVHFIVDEDGTIYQTCDLAYAALHAGDPLNATSVGIMLCLRGDAKKEPDSYAKRGDNRAVRMVRINGDVIKAFEYAERQLEAMTALGRVLLRLLPNVAPTYPQQSPGVPLFEAISEREAKSFSGFLGHYHLSPRHWDPGPFDFKAFVGRIAGTQSTPLATARDTDDLYAANEAADGGFFPVGPWGESRLWHGGIHLRAVENTEVRAIFPGRIVAARLRTEATGIGATNFVLVRHDLAFGRTPVRFYSLYTHLVDRDDSIPWLARLSRTVIGPDQVVVTFGGQDYQLDVFIEAGELIGRVGTAGPGDLAKPQLHLEIFSAVPLFTDMPYSPWEVVDGTAGGRFCTARRVNEVIDANHDDQLSREELHDFFARDKRRELAYLITLHVSEWTSEPSWADSLRSVADFRSLRPSEVDELIAQQITPTLWWSDPIAAHCELPTDGVVYHYHPIAFLDFWQRAAKDAAAMIPPAPEPGTEQDVRLEDDLRGSDMFGTSCQDLTLDEMLRGSDAPTCVRRRSTP